MVVILSSANKLAANTSKTTIKHQQKHQQQQLQQQLKAAHLLWLGDKQVGKSAAIVRYTTGRFIQEYSPAASNDWLYYRLPPTWPQGSPNQQSLVELLEQRDVQFKNSSNFFATSQSVASTVAATSATAPAGSAEQSLSSRVALDQLIGQELQEKQQMLERLRWADAYIVMYSISDTQSFQKAINYLNLIANKINSPTGEQQTITSKTGRTLISPQQPVATANGSSPNKRPILLLGNKLDLERCGARKVQTADGRHLAIRHQAMFAEVSVAQTGCQLEQLLAGLVDLIEPARLHPAGGGPQVAPNFEHLITSCTQQQQSPPAGQRKSSYPLVGLWRPKRRNSPELVNGLQCSVPARATLVRSQPVCGSTIVQSCRVLVGKPMVVANDFDQSRALASKVESGSPGSSGQPQLPAAANKGSKSSGRYETFKTSFRKASMAIVGGRAIASRKSPIEPMDKPPVVSVATVTAASPLLFQMGYCR